MGFSISADLIATLTLALCLLGAGTFILWQMMKGDTDTLVNQWREKLAPHTLQIVGLSFLIPTILMVAVATKLNSDAVTALLGSIIGYIFGAAKSSPSPPASETKSQPDPSGNRPNTRDGEAASAPRTEGAGH